MLKLYRTIFLENNSQNFKIAARSVERGVQRVL